MPTSENHPKSTGQTTGQAIGCPVGGQRPDTTGQNPRSALYIRGLPEITDRTNTGRLPLSVRPLPLGGADTGQTGQSIQPVYTEKGNLMGTYEALETERKERIEADIVIAEDTRTWSVVSLSGYYRKDPKPEVLQSGLTTLEAAERCRECFICNAIDDNNSHPYHKGSGVPLEHFNSRGIIAAALKVIGLEGDVSGIADHVATALENNNPHTPQCDSEIPF
ncbi:hypothetical protein [Ovoidimarina sediminis]|uniref:hypothetical protein n=1 Tax=Ovoidimarina sediminis TaxID=3079856 RepID=UPI00290C237C|nr:hypothetical protein [Rhodophyticola sp. MJ-SS7]MDU8946391.1 hypothetical protein [Rhodophyticola sp. MJ-SS7]